MLGIDNTVKKFNFFYTFMYIICVIELYRRIEIVLTEYGEIDMIKRHVKYTWGKLSNKASEIYIYINLFMLAKHFAREYERILLLTCRLQVIGCLSKIIRYFR